MNATAQSPDLRDYVIKKLEEPGIPKFLADFLNSCLRADALDFIALKPALENFRDRYPLAKQALNEQAEPDQQIADVFLMTNGEVRVNDRRGQPMSPYQGRLDYVQQRILSAAADGVRFHLAKWQEWSKDLEREQFETGGISPRDRNSFYPVNPRITTALFRLAMLIPLLIGAVLLSVAVGFVFLLYSGEVVIAWVIGTAPLADVANSAASAIESEATD